MPVQLCPCAAVLLCTCPAVYLSRCAPVQLCVCLAVQLRKVGWHLCVFPHAPWVPPPAPFSPSQLPSLLLPGHDPHISQHLLLLPDSKQKAFPSPTCRASHVPLDPSKPPSSSQFPCPWFPDINFVSSRFLGTWPPVLMCSRCTEAAAHPCNSGSTGLLSTDGDFPCCCERTPDKNNLGKEGFLLSHSLKVQSVLGQVCWGRRGSKSLRQLARCAQSGSGVRRLLVTSYFYSPKDPGPSNGPAPTLFNLIQNSSHSCGWRVISHLMLPS